VIHKSFTISDKYSSIFCKDGRLFKYFFDSDGNVLFFYLLNILASKSLSGRFFLSKMLSYFGKAKIDTSGHFKEILMVNSMVKKLIDCGQMTFKYYDIFEPDISFKNFDIVRCLNILNPRYFSEEMLVRAINNLRDSLIDDGIFIVGRTDREKIIDVSFYTKKNNKFILLKKIGKGSEISNLVTRKTWKRSKLTQ